MFIKRLVILLALIFSNASLFAQSCPFVGRWKLIDVEKDKLSILNDTCSHNFFLQIDTTIEPMNYSIAICDFLGTFQIKDSQVVFTGKIPYRTIKSLVICNWSIVSNSIGHIENWSLKDDTLVLYNNQYSFTFKAI